MITAKAKKQYIKSHGATCPHCGYEDEHNSVWEKQAVTMEIEPGKGTAYLQVHCGHCKKYFQEVYKLIDIVEGEQE